MDRSSPAATGASVSRLGEVSDLQSNARSRTWFAVRDRGPGSALTSEATRMQALRIVFDNRDGTVLARAESTGTIASTDATVQPFKRLYPRLVNPSVTPLGRSVDPDSLAIGRNGNLSVSDASGPSIDALTAKGRVIRAFTSPATLMPTQVDGVVDDVDGRRRSSARRRTAAVSKG